MPVGIKLVNQQAPVKQNNNVSLDCLFFLPQSVASTDIYCHIILACFANFVIITANYVNKRISFFKAEQTALERWYVKSKGQSQQSQHEEYVQQITHGWMTEIIC